MLDTLRKDHLYPYSYLKHPNMTKFIRDAIVYENCISSSSWTLPAHASLFLGSMPLEHGIHKKRGFSDFDLVMETRGEQFYPFTLNLKKRGYTTVGLSANAFISGYSGFSYGFDSFYDSLISERLGLNFNDNLLEKIIRRKNLTKSQFFKDVFGIFKSATGDIRSSAISREFLWNKGGEELVEQISNIRLRNPFFIFFNLMEMHNPYIPIEINRIIAKNKWTDYLTPYKFSTNERSRIKQAYKSQSFKIDSMLGKITSILKKNGSYDDTLIVIISDHGQSLWEHGFYSHELFLYDELVEVPLVVKYPKGWSPDGSDNSKLQSIIDIRSLVESTSLGKDSILTERNYVFAESYGFDLNAAERYRAFSDKSRVGSASLFRKKIYTKDCSITIDSNLKVEELKYKRDQANSRDREEQFEKALGLLLQRAKTDHLFQASKAE